MGCVFLVKRNFPHTSFDTIIVGNDFQVFLSLFTGEA